MFEALVHKVVQQRGQGGSAFCEGNFVYKIRIEIVVSKDQVEAVVAKIIEAATTGEILLFRVENDVY
ncbi:hypothetical protein ACFX14_032269 [Malus domestica]